MQGVWVVKRQSAEYGATVEPVSADLDHFQLVRLGPDQGPYRVMQHFLQKCFKVAEVPEDAEVFEDAESSEDAKSFEDAEELPPDTYVVSSQRLMHLNLQKNTQIPWCLTFKHYP